MSQNESPAPVDAFALLMHSMQVPGKMPPLVTDQVHMEPDVAARIVALTDDTQGIALLAAIRAQQRAMPLRLTMPYYKETAAELRRRVGRVAQGASESVVIESSASNDSQSPHMTFQRELLREWQTLAAQ